MFSGKTGRKHVTCFPQKQPENILPFCQAKPWQTDYVFSRNTDKEKDNVFSWETVGIKINFFCLFPWKTLKETGFLFQMQTDGIILLCFLFVCMGNCLSVFQANTNFTCFPRLFSWKTATIPSSVFPPKVEESAQEFPNLVNNSQAQPHSSKSHPILFPLYKI